MKQIASPRPIMTNVESRHSTTRGSGSVRTDRRQKPFHTTEMKAETEPSVKKTLRPGNPSRSGSSNAIFDDIARPQFSGKGISREGYP